MQVVVLERSYCCFMHKIIACAGLITCLMACNTNSSNKPAGINRDDSAYTIRGKIIGLDTGSVYLFNTEKDGNTTDTARLDKGSFEFKGIVHEPQFARLTILRKDHDMQRPLYLFLEPGVITIVAPLDSLATGRVNGGRSQAELDQFNISLLPLFQKERRLV